MGYGLKLGKEDSLQIAISNYLRLQYPHVLFCHIANERKTTPQRGKKLKRMGVRKGMPDLMVYHSKIEDSEFGVKVQSGIALELKVKPNKPTESQLEVLEQLEKQNWVTSVVYDFDSAKNLLDEYLK